MPIFIVVYRDDDGPYAQAFSTYAQAEAFKNSFSRNHDMVIVCTAVDQSVVLTTEEDADVE